MVKCIKVCSFHLFLAALGLHCCVQALSSCRGYCLAAVYRLLIALASLVAEHGLQSADSVVTAHAALWHVESSQTRDRTCDPCIGRRIPNHWATREVQSVLILNCSFAGTLSPKYILLIFITKMFGGKGFSFSHLHVQFFTFFGSSEKQGTSVSATN